MSIAKGSKSKIIYAEETSFGVPATAVANRGLFFSTESLMESIETFKSADIRSDRQTAAVRGGNISCDGSVTCDFAIRRHAILLRHLMASALPTAQALTATALDGTDVIVRGSYYIAPTIGTYLAKSSGNYTGTVATDFAGFTSGDKTIGGIAFQYVGTASVALYHYALVGTPDFPAVGLGFEKQVLGASTNAFILFNGGRIDSLELAVTQKDIVKSTWNFSFLGSVANSVTQAAPSSIVLPTDDPVSGYDSFVSLNGGTTLRPLKDASISIKNNLEKDVFYIGNRTRSDLPEGIREVSGRFQTFFQDLTEYNLFKNETVIPIVFTFIHAGECLKITLGEAKITGSGTPQVGGAGTVSCSFDFTVFVQSGTNDMLIDIYSTANTLYS